MLQRQKVSPSVTGLRTPRSRQFVLILAAVLTARLGSVGSYVSTPAEVGHLLQSSVSEFPLEQLVDVGGQEVADLQTETCQNWSRKHKLGRNAPHLCIQQAEVVHGLFQPALTSDLRPATLGADQLIDIALLNGRCEEHLEARLTQEAGAVRHCDDLRGNREKNISRLRAL